jgi:dienelactone hydrolase
MNFETNFFTTTKTGRYSTWGNLSQKTKYFWFGLHGSRMLCEQVIYKFNNFDPDEHFVVAPESLSRFYEKDFGGPVVGSWMTKRDRLHEIEDNGNYLSGLYSQFLTQLPDGCKKTIFGFSQGGTTVFRWLHSRNVEVDYLIPYACWIPEDIDLTESKTDLVQIKILYTYGVNDIYLTAELIEMVKDIITKNKLEVTQLPYDGDHRITKKQLSTIFTKYIKK